MIISRSSQGINQDKEVLAEVKEEIKAGIIIGASFLILTALVILIGGSNMFEKFDTYYVKVMNTSGLKPAPRSNWEV